MIYKILAITHPIMKIFPLIILFISASACINHVGAKIRAVPFHKVEMTSDFWRPRLVTQRKVLVPFAFEKTKPGVDHLQAAADY